MRMTAVLASMFLMGGSASADAPPNPIVALASCSADIMLNMQIGNWEKEALLPGHSSAISMASDARRKLIQCAETALPPAVAAAGDHADLRSAVKDYYVKEVAYINAIGTRSERHASDEEHQAFSRVRMEMTLAGMK